MADQTPINISFQLNPREGGVEAVYVRVSSKPVAKTVEMSEDAIVDIDKNGRLVGIEILNPGNMRVFTKIAQKYHHPELTSKALRAPIDELLHA